MAHSDALRTHALRGHHDDVEDTEATQLILETLFDIRAAVNEIHDVVVEDEDDEEEEADA
jgi:hypothetical protein